ncbi:MAG: pyrroloquinoline quinone biosynthesis peptide chaperone PqqD [Novosphingobium sp.]|nr:pyrroloquinoline quinone biosynthesis peptide chaperone PqqD [Novosphingobium sp.]
MTDAAIDPAAAVPRFRRGVKLRFDQARGHFVLLAPERAFVPDAIAAEILQLVDGERTLAVIAALLAEKFAAPLEVVTGDIIAVLTELAGRGAIAL